MSEHGTAATFDRAHLWHFRARFVRAIDGDTVQVLADNGYDSRAEPRVRLSNANAPERNTPAGRLALAALATLLAPPAYVAADPWGLRVRTEQRERIVAEERSFERWVGRVWVVGLDGTLTDAGEWLIAHGHATRPEEGR